MTMLSQNSIDIDGRLSGSVNQLLDRFASAAADEPAVRFYQSDASQENLTAEQLRHRAWGIAELLRQYAPSGSRVLLLLPPGIDYIASFIGCLDADMVAVPAYPLDAKNFKASLERLSGMVRDCEAAIALTASSGGVPDELLREHGGLSEMVWLDVGDAVPTSAFSPTTDIDDPSRLALLQYTSGSTGDPRGVMVSHRNLLENLTAMYVAYGIGKDDAFSSWLPPYHDMGLIGGILLPLYSAAPGYHMAPRTFVRNPELWLRTISDGGVTTTFEPNFAFDHVLSRVPEEKLSGMNLSRWRTAVNGAEPVRPETLRRFAERMAPTGFRLEHFAPSYGLAEATLVATAKSAEQEPLIVPLNRARLAAGIAMRGGASGSVQMVGCGSPIRRTEIRIVDPESRHCLPEGYVGEIWISGPGVAQGYWGRPEQSQEVFWAQTADGNDQASLRTGDLGFLFDGELFLSGRRKDVLIVDGLNVYPPDVEATLERAHPELRPGAGAVMPTEIGGREHIVICYELAAEDTVTVGDLPSRMRITLGSSFELTPIVVAIVRRGSTPRTTSGKIQRARYRTLFEQLRLDVLAASYAPGTTALRPGDEGREAETVHIPPDTPDHLALADLGFTFADLVGAAAEQLGRDVADVLAQPVAATLAPDSAQPVGDAVPTQNSTDDESTGGQDAATESSSDASLAVVAGTVAEVIGVEVGALAVDVPLRELGVDSRSTTVVCERLAARWATPVTPELLFDNPTVSTLAGALGALPEEALPQDDPAGADDAVPHVVPPVRTVTIIGMSCRFPGAPDLDSYQRLLESGGSAITYSTVAGMAERPAGWLDDAAVRTSKAFGISAREAAEMDPQQWFVLTACQHAIEDAGHRPADFAGRNVGVFVGIGSADHALQQATGSLEPSVYEATGTSHAVCANRVSYEFDLRGPSMAIDTACSSSLVALHEAWRALRDGECEAALVAGVNVLAAPRIFAALEDGGMLASDGVPRAFDDEAHGYVRGEGVGAVLLRSTEAAQWEGDRVYAVLEGAAVGHSGRSNGITAPSSRAQEDVIRAALAEADLAPRSVAFVESHGTGTQLGDPVELTALARVYGGQERIGEPCRVGAVKNTVGHLEAGAGMAGVIKTALVLGSRRLPATTGLTRPTSRFDWAASGLAPTTAPTELPAGETVHAGVSSFGFGGANAHVVLSASPQHPGRYPPQCNRAVVLSGTDPETVERDADRLRLVADETGHIDEVVRAQHPDPDAEERTVVVAADAERAREALAAIRDRDSHPAVTRWRAGAVPRPGVVFVLPGQGSLTSGAVHDLYRESSPFARALEATTGRLRRFGVIDALELLTARDVAPERVRRTDIQQPLLVALQLALAATLRRFGVGPDMVIGHSVGEISAAVLAGTLSEDDALELAVRRGAAMARAPEGVMFACNGDPDSVHTLLDQYAGWTVAAENGPRNLTLAGPAERAEDVRRELAEGGFAPRRLPVEHAFHTEAMVAASREIDEWAGTRRIDPASLHWISTVDTHPVETLRPGYWGEQMLAPVRFAGAMRQLGSAESGMLIELGVGATLVGRSHDLIPRKHLAVAATEQCDGAGAFLRALAAMAEWGISVDFSAQELSFPGRPPLALTDFDPPPETSITSPDERASESVMCASSDGSLQASSIRHEIATVSGFPDEQIQGTDRLHSDLGLDSLMVTALARRLSASSNAAADSLASWLGQDHSVSNVIGMLTGGDPIPSESSAAAVPPPDVPAYSCGERAPFPERPRTELPMTSGDRPTEDVRDPSTWNEVREVRQRFSAATGGSDSPYERIHHGFNGARTTMRDRDVVNFSSFDYLGLSHHPRVRRAAIEAVASYGTSAAATPVLYGETPVHKELEEALADLLGTESAIVFASGHATNVGTISHLLGEEDLIVHDEWAHDSAVRGALASGGTRRSFPHNDLSALDRMLSRTRDSYRRSLIYVEGAYSQDGDLPDLPGLVRAARRTGSLLMVDEAHSIGVLGGTGGGIGEEQGVSGSDVDLWMGTLSKALASLGGYVAGSTELIEFLRYSAPHYLFSTGPSPANAAAALESIRVIRDEPDRVRALRERAEYFCRRARAVGLDTGVSRDSAVVPVIIGEWARTVAVSNALLESGYNAMPIGYPAVPADASRIRFFINAEHDLTALNAAVDRVATILGKDPAPAGSLPDTVRTHVPPCSEAPSGFTALSPSTKHTVVAPAPESPRAIVFGTGTSVGRAIAGRLTAEGTAVVSTDDADGVTVRPEDVVYDCRPEQEGDTIRERILRVAPGTRVIRVIYSDRLPETLLSTHEAESDPAGHCDGDTLCTLARGAGIELTVLCAPVVFGPHCHGTVSAAARALRSGLITPCPVWEQDARLVYVGNLAAAAIQAARSDHTAGRVFTVADPDPVTWDHYLRRFGSMIGIEVTASTVADDDLLPDPLLPRTGSKAIAEFWTDQPYSLAHSLVETASWWWMTQ